MKKTAKLVIALLLLAALAIAAVLLLPGLLRPEEPAASVENPAGHVTFALDATDVVGKSEIVPSDGFLLPAAEYAFSEGDTALSLLQRVAGEHSIPIDVQGTGESAYCNGIGGLFGGDFGGMSGWLFFINGEMPMSGAGACPLSDGDEVIFRYTDSMDKYF